MEKLTITLIFVEKHFLFERKTSTFPYEDGDRKSLFGVTQDRWSSLSSNVGVLTDLIRTMAFLLSFCTVGLEFRGNFWNFPEPNHRLFKYRNFKSPYEIFIIKNSYQEKLELSKNSYWDHCLKIFIYVLL